MKPLPAAPMPVLEWRWTRFGDLTVHELQNIYMARQTVFGVEQACAYLDADGCDDRAFHLAAWSVGERLPLAYARVLDAGVKYAEISIGRVITMPTARGIGLGRELMARALAHADHAWPRAAIRISAQSRLEAFYADLGFEVVGDRYIEDGIPHTEMLRPPAG